MSIAALANDEILRTSRASLDFNRVINSRLNPAITTLGLNEASASILREAARPLAAENPVQNTPPSNALDGLVKYIPTESITLYVAATSALSSTTTAKFVTVEQLYWGFVALTPVLFLLIYVGKRRSQKLSFLPESPLAWPWWKLVAATVAFMVWALAVPPFITSDAGKIIAAFGALLVSTLLSLIGGVVEPSES